MGCRFHVEIPSSHSIAELKMYFVVQRPFFFRFPCAFPDFLVALQICPLLILMACACFMYESETVILDTYIIVEELSEHPENIYLLKKSV